MNDGMIDERFAYDLLSRWFEFVARCGFVTVVCLYVLAVALLVGGCWQTICESRRDEPRHRRRRRRAAMIPCNPPSPSRWISGMPLEPNKDSV